MRSAGGWRLTAWGLPFDARVGALAQGTPSMVEGWLLVPGAGVYTA